MHESRNSTPPACTYKRRLGKDIDILYMYPTPRASSRAADVLSLPISTAYRRRAAIFERRSSLGMHVSTAQWNRTSVPTPPKATSAARSKPLSHFSYIVVLNILSCFMAGSWPEGKSLGIYLVVCLLFGFFRMHVKWEQYGHWRAYWRPFCIYRPKRLCDLC